MFTTQTSELTLRHHAQVNDEHLIKDAHHLFDSLVSCPQLHKVGTLAAQHLLRFLQCTASVLDLHLRGVEMIEQRCMVRQGSIERLVVLCTVDEKMNYEEHQGLVELRTVNGTLHCPREHVLRSPERIHIFTKRSIVQQLQCEIDWVELLQSIW